MKNCIAGIFVILTIAAGLLAMDTSIPNLVAEDAEFNLVYAEIDSLHNKYNRMFNHAAPSYINDIKNKAMSDGPEQHIWKHFRFEGDEIKALFYYIFVKDFLDWDENGIKLTPKVRAVFDKFKQ